MKLFLICQFACLCVYIERWEEREAGPDDSSNRIIFLSHAKHAQNKRKKIYKRV